MKKYSKHIRQESSKDVERLKQGLSSFNKVTYLCTVYITLSPNEYTYPLFGAVQANGSPVVLVLTDSGKVHDLYPYNWKDEVEGIREFDKAAQEVIQVYYNQ